MNRTETRWPRSLETDTCGLEQRHRSSCHLCGHPHGRSVGTAHGGRREQLADVRDAKGDLVAREDVLLVDMLLERRGTPRQGVKQRLAVFCLVLDSNEVALVLSSNAGALPRRRLNRSLPTPAAAGTQRQNGRSGPGQRRGVGQRSRHDVEAEHRGLARRGVRWVGVQDSSGGIDRRGHEQARQDQGKSQHSGRARRAGRVAGVLDVACRQLRLMREPQVRSRRGQRRTRGRR